MTRGRHRDSWRGARSEHWPPTAYDDFDQIQKFKEMYYQITGIKPPAIQPTP